VLDLLGRTAAAGRSPAQSAYDALVTLSFYHIGYAVEDIDAAMTQFPGIEWNPVEHRELGPWPFSITFSLSGPPFLELIQGPSGGPWTPSSEPHHLGYWSDDLAADQAALAAQGLVPDFDGGVHGRPFSYHRLPGDLGRIELVDVAARPGFLASWGKSD
jgi:hypothetical protein